MDQEIRYADSGIVPEDGEPAMRERRPKGAVRRLELSHEWPHGVTNRGAASSGATNRAVNTGVTNSAAGNAGTAGTRVEAGDLFAGYENYARQRSR
jgi:hypothetical protein